MKKKYLCAFTLCTILGLSAQEVVWQKDIQSSTQDFLSQVTTTIDQQYLITGSSIHSKSQSPEANSPAPARLYRVVDNIKTLAKCRGFVLTIYFQ
ncbi:hypothetical protein ACQ7CU_09275 [Chryseobacterium arthrosphaerae]|uniref:hypothetical protein n=1 Tax=Chryseobacterium arthrosphaerae TaxID=651561 RepID=UPI003D3487B3